MPNLTFEEFRDGSTMPRADVERVHSDAPAYFQTRELWHRNRINDGLRRRYVVPFGLAEGQPAQAEPDPALVPTTIKMWMTAALTLDFYQKLGFNPSSAQDQTIIEAAEAAKTALRDAADPNKLPLPELPLAADRPDESGIQRGGPYISSSNTPYGWFDQQAALRNEGGW